MTADFVALFNYMKIVLRRCCFIHFKENNCSPDTCVERLFSDLHICGYLVWLMICLIIFSLQVLSMSSHTLPTTLTLSLTISLPLTFIASSPETSWRPKSIFFLTLHDLVLELAPGLLKREFRRVFEGSAGIHDQPKSKPFNQNIQYQCFALETTAPHKPTNSHYRDTHMHSTLSWHGQKLWCGHGASVLGMIGMA